MAIDSQLRPHRRTRLIETTNKPWLKPQLIVLYRGKADESVLVVCKQVGVHWIAPGFRKFDCHTYFGQGEQCGMCSSPSNT